MQTKLLTGYSLYYVKNMEGFLMSKSSKHTVSRIIRIFISLLIGTLLEATSVHLSEGQVSAGRLIFGESHQAEQVSISGSTFRSPGRERMPLKYAESLKSGLLPSHVIFPRLKEHRAAINWKASITRPDQLMKRFDRKGQNTPV